MTAEAPNERAPGGSGFERRNFIKGGAVGAAGVAGLALTGASGTAAERAGRRAPLEAVRHLPDPAPEDLEQGGGKTYNGGPGGQPAYRVDDAKGLKRALSKASSGEIIRVEDDAVIDLTGDEGLSVPSGVIIAGGRGNNGSSGGVLLTQRNTTGTPDEDLPLFAVEGSGVRFTGLRIQGPRLADYWDPEGYDTPGEHTEYKTRIIGGLKFLGDDGRVDNCQMYGFTHAAVSFGYAKSSGASGRVEYCSIHNNPMEHYGYGVNVWGVGSAAIIEWNYFDYNRHSIAGYGGADNHYTARNNLVGPNPISHAFDMHGKSGVAGGTILIHHNTFQFSENTDDAYPAERSQEAIKIRGVPDGRCDINKNWFHHTYKPTDPDGEPAQAYRQNGVDSWTNMYADGNHFGSDEPSTDIGHPR
ncbi:hypothetical protein [Salinifilum ghardaiensis]